MLAASSAQSKVTDFYRPTRSHRSPSPKRCKPSGEISVPRTPKRTAIISVPEIPCSLDLPVTFGLLLQHFNGADQVVSILYNRQELITFTKLQSGVQKCTRRNFGLKQLGQIKTVYPEAYFYEQLRITRQEGILQCRGPGFELTIRPNLSNDLSKYGFQTPVKSPRKLYDVTPTKTPPRTPSKRPYSALSPMKTPPKCSRVLLPPASPSSPSRCIPMVAGAKPFTGGRLVARSQIFRRNLFNILRSRHQEFLLTLSPPIRLTQEEENRLTAWHPEFLLDESSLQILPDDLPAAPVVEKVTTAKDLLSISAVGRVLKLDTIQDTAVDQERSQKVDDKQQSLPLTVPSAPTIKGIPAKLLEKIREKESQKKRLAMLRSPEEESRQRQLSRLPDFVRIVNMYFATEGKSVLSASQVHKKLADSYPSPMSLKDIEDHLKLLRDLVPDWISHTDITDKGSYLRLNRDMEVGDVMKALEKKS